MQKEKGAAPTAPLIIITAINYIGNRYRPQVCEHYSAIRLQRQYCSPHARMCKELSGYRKRTRLQKKHDLLNANRCSRCHLSIRGYSYCITSLRHEVLS